MIDMGMLAYDLAEVLASEDYQIDVDSDDVAAALPGFLESLRVSARADGREVTW